jgi:hypothetical protein
MLCGADIEMDANSVYPWYLDKRVGRFMNGSAFKSHGMLGSCDGWPLAVRALFRDLSASSCLRCGIINPDTQPRPRHYLTRDPTSRSSHRLAISCNQ